MQFYYSRRPRTQLPVEALLRAEEMQAQNYDQNKAQYDTLTRALAQVKVRKEDQGYLEQKRAEIETGLDGIARDMAGGVRWEQARHVMTDLAQKVMADPVLVGLQRARDYQDKDDAAAAALRLKGENPLDYSTTRGKTLYTRKEDGKYEFNEYDYGKIEPEAAWQAQADAITADVKPDTVSLAPQEIGDYMKKSTVQLLNDKKFEGLKTQLTHRYLGSTSGQARMRQLMHFDGLTEQQATQKMQEEIMETARTKIFSNEHATYELSPNADLRNDLIRQAAKPGRAGTAGSGAGLAPSPFVHTTGDVEINREYEKDLIDESGFDTKTNRWFTGPSNGGMAATPGGLALTNQTATSSSTNPKLEEFKKRNPAMVGKNDLETARTYNAFVKSRNAVTRGVTGFASDEVNAQFTNMAKNAVRLGVPTSPGSAYVIGGDKSNGATLEERAGLKTGKIEVKAIGINTRSLPGMPPGLDGGMLVRLTDENGKTADVIVPSDQATQGAVATLNGVNRAIDQTPTRSIGSRPQKTDLIVPDTSGVLNLVRGPSKNGQDYSTARFALRVANYASGDKKAPQLHPMLDLYAWTGNHWEQLSDAEAREAGFAQHSFTPQEIENLTEKQLTGHPAVINGLKVAERKGFTPPSLPE